MATRISVDLPPDVYQHPAERPRRDGVTVKSLVKRLLACSDREIERLELERKRRIWRSN
jgi:hypothetical protein